MTAATSSDLHGARVLVTGAGGFVGRHLVRRLSADGADVVALTRVDCDLTDRPAVTAAVRDAGPDAVVHLAAMRERADADGRAATAWVNTLSGAWVVEAVPDRCRVVVRLGSSTEYGASARLMDEDTPLHPRGWFGATKAAGSLLFSAAAVERGVRSAVLRAFQVYGPGDKPSRLVPTVLRAAQDGAPLPLTSPGLRRDWVWVGDVVDACLRAVVQADLPTGALYNIGTGVQTTNEDLVALAQQVTGRRIDARPDAHPGRDWDSADWVADPSAARADLGWYPTVDLRDGLARCWAALCP